MPDNRLRVLIADSHYLIAMDLERILTETRKCDVNLCSLAALEENLQSLRYDIVMVDAVVSSSLNLDHATAITRTGARAVFLTTIDDFYVAYPALQDYAALEKPFDPDRVAALVREYEHSLAQAQRQEN